MSKDNPKNIDYNKDGVSDGYDDVLAVQDKNKDGTVTDKEKTAYRKSQGSVTTKMKFDKEGNPISQTTTPATPPPEPSMTVEGYGFNEQFLKDNPDVRAVIKDAIKYDWPQVVLNRVIEAKTKFGKQTTDAQSSFDINIAGIKNEDLLKQVSDRTAALKQQVLFSGVKISDEEIARFARESVRSGLSDADSLAFISEGYKTSSAVKGKVQDVTGTAFGIQDQLKTLANSYGVRVTDDLLRQKTGEALGQGERWREWVAGQEDFFKQQAKVLYPKAAQMLDTMSLKQISEPYFADAADVLGLSSAQIDLLDPKWTGFLNGANGVLSRDEWDRVLKTDVRFGFDKSTKARQEYASLSDELLSAFGMA